MKTLFISATVTFLNIASNIPDILFLRHEVLNQLT